MNTEFAIRTPILPLKESKKLWNAISKSSKVHTFEEASCEGGADIEIDHENITLDALRSFQIPKSCYEWDLSTSRHPKQVEEFPTSLHPYLLGGPDHPIPDYGWDCSVKITMIPPNLRIPLCFKYEIGNTLRHLGRNFVNYHSVDISYFRPHAGPFPEQSPPFAIPDDESLEKAISDLWEDYGLPRCGSTGHLESRITPRSRAERFDPDVSEWQWPEFEAFLQRVAEKSPIQWFVIRSRLNPGFMNGQTEVSENAPELLRAITGACPYEQFDLRYNAIVSMSWRDREKRRKKLKEPELQEVGQLVLNHTREALLKILIEPEGYQFILEFNGVDALETFTESTLYKKADWMT